MAPAPFAVQHLVVIAHAQCNRLQASSMFAGGSCASSTKQLPASDCASMLAASLSLCLSCSRVLTSAMHCTSRACSSRALPRCCRWLAGQATCLWTQWAPHKHCQCWCSSLCTRWVEGHSKQLSCLACSFPASSSTCSAFLQAAMHFLQASACCDVASAVRSVSWFVCGLTSVAVQRQLQVAAGTFQQQWCIFQAFA